MESDVYMLSLDGDSARLREVADLLLWLKVHVDATPQDMVKAAPGWLIHAFAPERTAEENEVWLVQWQASPDPLKFERESGWTASSWMCWFSPDNEFWRVDKAFFIDENESSLTIKLEHDDDPIPLEAFRWLAVTAGFRVGDVFRIT